MRKNHNIIFDYNIRVMAVLLISPQVAIWLWAESLAFALPVVPLKYLFQSQPGIDYSFHGVFSYGNKAFVKEE
jgi:hypothetical protein